MDAAQQNESQSGEVEVLPPAHLPSVPTPQAFPDSKQLQNVDNPAELVVKDVTGGDKSLIALLTKAPKLRKKIMELQQSHPEYLTMDEPAFKRDHRDLITLVTQRIRVSLWQEFESAIHNNRVMQIQQIFAGTCSETTFYHLIDNPIRLAYVLCAPADYIVMLKEAHSAGLEKLREIFSARIIDDDGYLNPKAADIVVKAFALIDARLKGAVIQKVDQRHLHATVPASEVNKQLGIPDDMGVLEKELEKARAQIAQMTALPRHPTTEQLKESVKDIVIDCVDMNTNPALGGNSKILK